MPDLTLLGDRSASEFLREYWQKKPLLVRGAFPDFADPLTPEYLAGLACEGPTESRLIMTEDQGRPFALRNGPFDPEDFAALPERDWTVLVRHVDKLLPEVAALLSPFDFLPGWRIDDVMVSYAAPGGSVGPHVDQYDVFLLQGRGRRRWQISTDAEAPAERRDDTALDVLAEFEPTDEWDLEPGDMLYLPPGVAHHGIALDKCLTYSIGFRAPASDELLAGWFEYLMTRVDPAERYGDPDIKPAEHPGKIEKSALERVRDLLEKALDHEPDEFRRWFGEFITGDESLPPAEAPPRAIGLERLKRQLDAGHRVVRNPLSRVAYIARGDQAWLFVAGKAHRTSLSLAARLGDESRLGYQDLRGVLQQPDDAGVLLELINAGHWLVEAS